MTWQIQITQKKDNEGNNLPLWDIIQWNSNDPNTRYTVTITTAVKEIAYPN
jgi:hypothetical protein